MLSSARDRGVARRLRFACREVGLRSNPSAPAVVLSKSMGGVCFEFAEWLIQAVMRSRGAW